jgi:hypothetical protein
LRYDSTVIHEVAERLYSAAAVTEVIWSLIGLLLGIPFGWVSGARWEQTMTGALIGGAFGLGIGYWVGHLRALTLRFTAQMALCQAQIEANTRPASKEDGHTFSGPRGAGSRMGNVMGR